MQRFYQLFSVISAGIKEYWLKLSGRDRRAVLILSAAAVVLFLYFGVISPLVSWHNKMQIAVNNAHADFVFVKQNIADIKRAESLKSMAKSKDPVTTISTSGRRAGIVFSRVQPGSGGISVWINEINYQQLLGWLLQVNSSTGLSVKQIRLENTSESGIVKTFMQLGQ